MTGAAPPLRKAAPIVIVVRYPDALEREHATTRQVRFLKGFGHYIQWDKRLLLVDPMQREIRIAGQVAAIGRGTRVAL